MRKVININHGWKVILPNQNKEISISLPHTFNNVDGQDGGNDYLRGKCNYYYRFKNTFSQNEDVYLEVKGANSVASVYLNNNFLTVHKGGYSPFIVKLSQYLQDDNLLKIMVDNSNFSDVYPSRADFTFYGGLYRDVNLIIVNKEHFEFDDYGGNGLRVNIKKENGEWFISPIVKTNSQNKVEIVLKDDKDKEVCKLVNNKFVKINNPHLWNGISDPYLYKVVASLRDDDLLDQIETFCGFREFYFSSKSGFILNGKKYPLRGVARHQDYLNKGNALIKVDHEKDISLILEMGANCLRLAHYQQDDYFYYLCDKNGLLVYSEIPFISQYLPNGDDNAISQLKELIHQTYNHPSIFVYGIANEITMFKNNKQEKLHLLKVLNNICHKEDNTRLTSLACFAMCSPFNKTSKITDIVGWNLYLGWYVPFLFLNDIWLSLFHFLFPKRILAFSEYGAEGMITLHSAHPKRMDNSEEYQCKYHEYMLRCFQRHPYLYLSFVWIMFDFGSDGREQGGDNGKNHKGLVTFDRKTKKDAFYLYKAFWSSEDFIHICSKRYKNRHEKKTEIKIYSHTDKIISVFQNNKLIKQFKNKKIFKFRCLLKDRENIFVVTDGQHSDTIIINKVDSIDNSYILKDGNSYSWEKDLK